jgi:cutinase
MGEVVGPPLASQMQTAFGTVAVQGVDYPASVDGAVTGAESPATAMGSLVMANLTNMALAACPNTKVVLAGYSQGAEQVHGALMNLNAGQVSVSSAVAHMRDCAC